MTKPVKLLIPIKTFDEQLLLPVGTELTEELLDQLIAKSTYSLTNQFLLQHASVKKDIIHHISTPPYDVVFADHPMQEKVIRLAGKVQVIQPVLDYLDYFQKNDYYTYRHVLMVFALSILLSIITLAEKFSGGKRFPFDPTHDFGKVCVPLDILLKQKPLTWKEKKMLRQHTLAGYILMAYYLRDKNHISAIICRDHHEFLDGSGYPRGIQMSDPLVELVSACDVYDALISPRPYRGVPYDNRTALEVITSLASQRKIGWTVAKTLVSLNRADKPHFSECDISPVNRGVPPADNVYGKTVDEK